MNTNNLAYHDLQWCLRRAPRKLLELMKKHGAIVMVAGGYIRSCVSNEKINDIDLFASSAETSKALALELAEGDEKRIGTTDNCYYVRGFGVHIQFIHRWSFTDPSACILSFDFTIARAAFWWNRNPTESDPDAGKWRSAIDPNFYPDLAGKRLIYTSPVRIEESGGSMLRVLKFYQRGYRIPLDSMGAVIARLVHGVTTLPDWDKGPDGSVDEPRLAKVLSGLLREVDPSVDPSHVAHLPSGGDDVEQEGTS